MRFEIGNPAKYHAALYIRLSREDENEGPSESVTNQKALLQEFVEQYRIGVYDTYVDDGWSGTGFDRPAFLRMIADIEAKQVNMVITKDLSRLGRDYIMTGHYMERFFPEHRVRYVSLLDGIDTGVESGANEITPFRALMNDMYARDISKKIKSVKREKQRRGQFIGGKPLYGYQKHPTEKNRIIVDGEAAAVVRRIFSMALQGQSCRSIAAALNEKHVPTPAVYCGRNMGQSGPYSGLWSSERISELLQNETYLGNMVQGRRVKISYKSKKCLRRDRCDWVVVEGTHEPLVDAETFRSVQMLIASRRHTRSRTYDYLLRGLIFCHECGSPMAVINRKNTAGEDVLYLVCRTYQRFTKAGACTCHCVREKTVTDAVLNKVREVCDSALCPAELIPLAESAVREAEDAVSSAQTLRVLNRRLDMLTEHLDRMYLDKISGLLTETDFSRIYGKLSEERAEIQQRVEEAEQLSECRAPAEQRAEELVQQFLNTALTGREVLLRLIERVEITESREIELRFRFCLPDVGRSEAISSH